MRKIYLLMLSLLVAIAANAAETQLYLIGEPAGGWDTSKGVEMTPVEGEAGVFTYTLETNGDKWFGFASQLGGSWDDFNGKYRYGADSNDYDVVANPVSNMNKPNANSWKVGAGKWELRANTNTNKLTVTNLGQVQVEKAYAIHGNMWADANGWTAKPMTESNGKWTLTAECNNSGEFGIRVYKKGGDYQDQNGQLAWLAAADDASKTIKLGTPANASSDNKGNFVWGFACTATFVFDPEANTLTVTTEEEILPEPTYDGMTLFFDNTNSNWNEVYAYCWNNGGGENHSWSGEPAVKVEGTENLWMYKVVGKTYDMVIFNNNNNGSQTGDLQAVHGHVYTNDGNHTAHVFDAPATTEVAVHADFNGKVHADGTHFSGDVTTDNANFKLTVTAAEGHEVFYRVFAPAAASYAAAPASTFAGYKAVEGGEITIPVGEGSLGLSTRVHGVLSTPTMYSFAVTNNDTPTGVEGIEVENNATAVYYNLQGVRVANPEAGHVYIRVANGTSAKVRF